MRNATKLLSILLKRFCDISVINDVIMTSCSQRLHHERQAQVIRIKNEKLEKLCRALQLERNQLQEQVRGVSIIAVSLCGCVCIIVCVC